MPRVTAFGRSGPNALTEQVMGRADLFMVAEAKDIAQHLMDRWNNVGVVAACTTTRTFPTPFPTPII